MKNVSIRHTYCSEPSISHRLFDGLNKANWLAWDPDILAPNCSESIPVPEAKLKEVLTIERNDGTPVLSIERREELLPVIADTNVNETGIVPLQNLQRFQC